MRTHILSIAQMAAGCLLGVATFSARCAPVPADLAPAQGATPPAGDRGPYCGGVSAVSPVVTRGGNSGGGSSGALGSEPPKTLSDLVGIAMKNNPDTRVAWTQAEEAALNLGITRSKYGPMLAAQASGLYERSTFPMPTSLIPSGYFKSDAEALIPALTFKWLLYDFGGRSAAIDQADQTLAGANFGFTATHRKVSIAVTQRFYSLATQVAREAAAQASLESAQKVQESAQARQDRGLGTAPDTLQARAATAEALLNLEGADAAVDDARMALLETAGVRPDTYLCVSIPTVGSSQRASEGDLDHMIDQAIATRPEVNAAVAKVKAGEAAIRFAKSEYFPKIELTANLGENIGRLRSAGGDWSSVTQPLYGVGLKFEVPIYDGTIRRNDVQEARSKQEAAKAQLDGTKNQVVHEVVKAYNDLRVSLQRRDSSAALMSAAQDAFDSTLASYQHGLATLTELESAVAALARARMAVSEAGADVLTARAVLTFATGDMMDAGP